MIINPFFQFSTTSDTGIDSVPIKGIVNIEDFDGVGTPKQYLKIAQGTLTSTSTILDFINDSSVSKVLSDISQLEKIIENGNVGWRLLGRVAGGNIGQDAVDLSYNVYSQDGGATGDWSFATGYNTKASGMYSTAEGLRTIASGQGSHAEGTFGGESLFTVASGNGAHAEGEGTSAQGRASHSEGFLTTAQNDYMHAAGMMNVGTATDTIHETGIGTSDTDTKNAFEIYTDGRIVAPELTIARVNTGKSLTTKEYVDLIAGGNDVIQESIIGTYDLPDTSIYKRYYLDITGQVDIYKPIEPLEIGQRGRIILENSTLSTPPVVSFEEGVFIFPNDAAPDIDTKRFNKTIIEYEVAGTDTILCNLVSEYFTPPPTTFEMIVTSSVQPIFDATGGSLDYIDNGDGTWTVSSYDQITKVITLGGK